MKEEYGKIVFDRLKEELKKTSTQWNETEKKLQLHFVLTSEEGDLREIYTELTSPGRFYDLEVYLEAEKDGFGTTTIFSLINEDDYEHDWFWKYYQLMGVNKDKVLK